MKNLITFLCVFISGHLYANTSEWKSLEPQGNVKEAYVHSKYPQVIFTVLVNKEKFDLKDFSAEKYLAALPDTKEIHHKILGIKAWKITSHEVETKEELIVVKIRGEYMRADKKVLFEEWHHFQPLQFLQLQLIKNVEDPAKGESLFESTQKKWLLL